MISRLFICNLERSCLIPVLGSGATIFPTTSSFMLLFSPEPFSRTFYTIWLVWLVYVFIFKAHSSSSFNRIWVIESSSLPNRS